MLVLFVTRVVQGGREMRSCYGRGSCAFGGLT